MQAIRGLQRGARRFATTLANVEGGFSVSAESVKQLESLAAKEGHYAAIRTVPRESWGQLPKPFLRQALDDLRATARKHEISRNGVVPHEGYEYMHAPHMYDLDNWPNKKLFVGSMVGGIVVGGLIVIPGILFAYSEYKRKSA